MATCTYTPWGAAHNVISHIRGVKTVSTSTHGGIMVSQGFANKFFSKAALKVAEMYSGYFCYEEDADWMVPTFELNVQQRRTILTSDKFAQMSDQEVEDYLIEQLSGTNPDYLVERGFEPRGELYEIHKMRIVVDKARLAKDPDLITCPWGDTKTFMHGVNLVTTADHKRHFVTAESYSKQRDADRVDSLFMRLSECDVVVSDIVANSSEIEPLDVRLPKYAVDLANSYLELLKNDPEADKRELAGGFYGFRSRYNGTMETARSEFINQYAAERNVSSSEAIDVFNKCLSDALDNVNTEFHNCRIFADAKPRLNA
ncbi:hypothetical protein F0267_01240 [Vibrio coralliilyticus]|uniref:DUF7007 domain-containing protein n=2 Tax=Vibrio TaxID=662 RepID=A0AAU9QS31_9VIBR|nr:hypothetical protein [Vibrio coralliilyticus]NOH36847.1 hypothetical protein [Vibrio coralliilyticus]CAH1589099.1 conserved hypothetical protein [Vibrio jasicida]CAH1599678.1 conserved hypothetical protein [Vibrio jasicida]